MGNHPTVGAPIIRIIFASRLLIVSHHVHASNITVSLAYSLLCNLYPLTLECNCLSGSLLATQRHPAHTQPTMSDYHGLLFTIAPLAGRLSAVQGLVPA